MQWNRIGAFVILAMFVISIVPAVFADDSNANDTNINTTETGNAAGLGVQARVQANEQVRETLTQLRERVKEMRDVRLQVRSDIAQGRLALLDARQKLVQDNEDLRKCKLENSTDCKDLRSSVMLNAQATLLATADHILDVLAKLKEQLQASTSLTDDEKSKAVADVDARINAIQEARDTVAKLDENSDRSAYQDAVSAIRDAWKDARAGIRMKASQLAWGEVKAVTDAVERLSAKLDKAIADIKAKGIDTSSVESLKTQFGTELAGAKTHLDAAKAAYLGITSGKVDAKDKTVRDEMQAARTSLKDAHTTLKEIVKQLRELVKSQRQEAKAETQANREVKQEAKQAAKNESAREDAQESAQNNTETNETED